MLLVAVPAIPAIKAAARPLIDYLGILLIALAASGLTLVTSWGGTTYAWNSPTIIWMAIGSVVALGLFVFVELRARPSQCCRCDCSATRFSPSQRR